MQNLTTIQNILTDHLSKYDEIQLVFLFGSTASEHHSKESDIDIAILFQIEPDFYYLDDIKDSLSKLIKKQIDIVILNNASPIIKMQILKNGIPLIRRGSSYEEFFTRTVVEYADLKIVRKEIEDNILKGRQYA